MKKTFALFILSLGLLTFAYLVRVPIEAYRWPSVPGTAMERIGDTQNYVYAVDEMRLINTRQEATYRSVQAGDPLQVYYDPDDYANALAVPTSAKLLALFTGLVGMIGIVGSLFLIVRNRLTAQDYYGHPCPS